MKKVISIILLFLGPFCIVAQNYVDLAKIHYSFTPQNAPVDDSLSLLSGTEIQEFSSDITLPIVLKNENVFLTGIIYDQTTLNTSDNKSTVYTINPKIGYKINHSEKLSSTWVVLPKISSDLKNIDNKHYQFGGVGLLSIKKSENFTYKFGAYFNKELFGPFAVPLVGFYYLSKNQKFEANFTLPIAASMNYKIHKNIATGLTFNAFVRSYQLGELTNSYLVKSSNELYGTLQFNFLPVVIESQVGYSIGRSYRAYTNEDKIDFGFSAFKFGDDRTQLNHDFEDGLIFKLRILYRFAIK